MGWWKVKDVESGGIDFGERPGKLNHFEKMPSDWLVGGDDPADEMGRCIDEIVKCYEEAWGRKPFKRELRAVFNFCINAMELEE